jgi:diketogulonate reductase-like aldo/keto reductase
MLRNHNARQIVLWLHGARELQISWFYDAAIRLVGQLLYDPRRRTRTLALLDAILSKNNKTTAKIVLNWVGLPSVRALPMSGRQGAWGGEGES